MSLFTFAFPSLFIGFFIIFVILFGIFFYTNWRLSAQDDNMQILYDSQQKLQENMVRLNQFIFSPQNLENRENKEVKNINLGNNNSNSLIEVPYISEYDIDEVEYEEEEEEEDEDEDEDEEEEEEEEDEEEDEDEDEEEDNELILDIEKQVILTDVNRMIPEQIEIDKYEEDNGEDKGSLPIEDKTEKIEKIEINAIDFKRYSVQELREYAKKKNIPQVNKLGKKELVKILSY